MAEFTDYNFDIPSPQRGAVQPREETSVLTGLIGGLDTGVKAVESKYYNDSIDSNRSQKQGLDTLATGLFQVDRQANNVPQAARDAVTTLNNTRAGVDQGVLPSSTYQVQLQNLTNQVMTAHPDAAYEIMSYLKASGHYAQMFPQLEAQQKAQTADQDAIQKGRDSQIAYYFDNGGMPGTNPDDAQRAGQQLMLAHAQQAQAVQSVQMAHEAATLDLETQKFHLSEADRIGMQGIQAEIAARTLPIYQSLQALINTAPEGQQDGFREKMIPLVDNMVATAKSSAISHMVKMGISTTDNITLINKELDDQAAGIKLIYADKSGALETTLKNIHNQYGIDVARAAPVISRLSVLIGSNQVAALLGPTSLLDPGLVKQISSEWQKVSSSVDGQIALNNVVSILRGNTNLKDYSDKEAARYIGGVVTGKLSSEAAIVGDNGTAVDHAVYANTMSNVINAVHSLTPASNSKDLVNASRLIATQNSRMAIDKLVADADTKERGNALGMASHAGSLKLLQDFQAGSDQNTVLGLPVGNRSQKIVFDKNAGVYKVQFDPSDPSLKSLSPQAIARLKSSPVYGPLTERVTAMNQVLDHAVKTSKYDADIPKGVTPIQLRVAYGTNTPIPTHTKDGEPTPDQRWQNAAQNLEDVLKRFPLIVNSQDTGR